MEREQVYKEIKEMFGLVPGFFQAIADASLELKWRLFKGVQSDGETIPI